MSTLLSAKFFFGVRPAGKLRSASYGSKHHHSLFLKYHFLHTSTHNSKNTGCTWIFYMLNDCSTIRDVCFLGQSCVQDMIGESVFNAPLVCPYRNNLKTTGCMLTFYLLNNCSIIEHIPFVVQSFMRDLTSEDPNMHHVCSVIQHCVRILQACTYITL